MEFHILSTKRCRVQQTETNFKLIKDSLNQLREDLHEAEINFHRKSLGNATEEDDMDQPDQFTSSVSLLEHCEHPWTEEPEFPDVNKAALQYYSRAKKKKSANKEEGPDLRRIKDKKIKEKPTLGFLKDLSKMWIAGSNPPSLGPGTYNPQDCTTIKPRDPTRQSSAFSNRQCRGDLMYMGDNNHTLRPRYDKVQFEHSADEVKKPPKLPAWKTFNAYQSSRLGNSKSLTDFKLTSEDAPQYIFPHAPPTQSISKAHTFSHVPRFQDPLAASSSSNNLGSTYRASWDDKVRFAKGNTFAKSKRKPLNSDNGVESNSPWNWRKKADSE